MAISNILEESTLRVTCIGEVMIEVAPDGAGWNVGMAGDTFNTAWYLRQCLSADYAVAYITRLGTDRRSDWMLAEMAAAGIETDGIQRDPIRLPGLYLIDLEGGERSFTYWRSSSAARAMAEEPAALARSLANADTLFLSAITLAILPSEGRTTLVDLLKARKKAGTRLVFDTNYRPALWESTEMARETIVRVAALADILLPSADDEALLFGDASPDASLARYINVGVPEIIIKSGGAQVPFAVNGTTFIEERLPRKTPVDTTAAGDSFGAGYLAARLGGATPRAAIRAAHAIAMQVISQPGALARIDPSHILHLTAPSD